MDAERLTVPALLRRHAGTTPDLQFVITEDAALTYGELDRTSRRSAARLIRAGVGKGTRVGLSGFRVSPANEAIEKIGDKDMADKDSSVTTALDRMVTRATPDLALNALKGTAEMMTSPVEMFREMFGVMTNPMRVFTLGERLLSGRPLSESAPGAGDHRPQSKTRAGQPMGGVVIEYPKIANGAVERVLAFNNHEYIALKGPDEAPFFSSHGPLTDLQGNTLPGTRLGTTFPVDPKTFPETRVWPVSQVEPFDEDVL